VRVVELPANVLDPDVVSVLNADGIGDKAGDEVLLEDLTGLEPVKVLTGPDMVAVVDAIKPVEEVGDPSGAPLGEGHLQRRIVAEHPGPQKVGSRHADVHRLQAHHDVYGGIGGGHRDLAGRTEVDVEDAVCVHQRLPEWVPVLGVETRQPQSGRVLREAERVAALGGHSTDFVCG
jgi:hypothetical protein